MCIFLNIMIWFIETMEKSGKRKRCLYGRASCQAVGRSVMLAPGVEEKVPACFTVHILAPPASQAKAGSAGSKTDFIS